MQFISFSLPKTYQAYFKIYTLINLFNQNILTNEKISSHFCTQLGAYYVLLWGLNWLAFLRW